MLILFYAFLQIALADGAVDKIEVFPDRFFVKETSPLLLTTGVDPGPSLCLNDPSHTRNRGQTWGPFHDDGQNGDAISGDKVFSLKIEAYTHKAGPYKLFWIQCPKWVAVASAKPHALIGGNISGLALARPSLVEVMQGILKNVWERW